MSPTKDKPARWMGPPIARSNGVRIYARLREPKTERGRPRLWIVIRQEAGPKRWRVAENLSYVNGVDIQFEARPTDDGSAKKRRDARR